jgi:hypothetical protein
MYEINGKIDENDLAYVRERYSEPTIAMPCPIKYFGKGQYEGKINPHISRFLIGGKVVDVFHIKPIYYLHQNGQWRPMSEIAHGFGNSWIDLKSDWDTKLDLRYMRWLLLRMEIVKGKMNIPSPFGRTMTMGKVPIRLNQEIFLTTSTFYPDPNPETTSVDGYVIRNNLAGCVGFSTLRGDNGNDAQSDLTAFASFLGNDYGEPDCGSPNWNGMSRSIFLFDSSAIPDTDTISSATFSAWGDLSENMYSQTADLVQSTVASNTNLVNSDFQGTVNDTTLQSDTQIGLGSWNAAGYNDYALNATGIGNVSKTSVTKLGIRLSADRTNSAPSWASGRSSVYGATAEYTGTGRDPKLVVVHAASSAIKTYLGLATASVKTINGLAIASRKTWGGLA